MRPLTTSRLIPLICLMVANRLSTGLAIPSDWQWYLHSLTLTLALAAAFWALLSLVPYSRLALKCALAALTASVGADALGQVAGLFSHGYPVWGVTQGLAILIVLPFYWLRSFHQPSAPLDLEHYFCLRARPRGVQDLLISLAGCFGPAGGYAIYANGQMYQFKSGVLTATKLSPHVALRYFHIVKGRPISPSGLLRLRQLVGTKWTLRTNCLTVLGRVWTRRLRAKHA